MNLKITAYCIYFIIMAFITIVVGWLCYKNGEHYLKDIFAHDSEIVQPLNKLLLVGYYLVNLGYVAISMQTWQVMSNWLDVLDWLGDKIGGIVILLAIMHYFNIAITAFVGNHIKRKQLTHQ